MSNIPFFRHTSILLPLFFLISLPCSYGQGNGDAAISTVELRQKADAVPTLRSLIIRQNGQLKMEAYFHGRDPSRAFNIKSASKSIISLLVGIAVDKGYISSTEKTLGDYFPDYFEANPDSQKASITIRHLLSMQSGLETTSFYNYGAWVMSDNWVEYQLDQPFREEPGGKMVYSTGTSHLLSVILTKASGKSTRRFANEYLFEPLDITIGGWDRDPQGYYMGGNNMAMKPLDLVKIGQMILKGGTYEGKRIISGEWLADSFQSYTRSNYNPYDYGYMWWNKPVGKYTVYFAWGYGGQYLFIIPRLEAVAVLTSSLAGATQRRSYKRPVFDLLQNQIIPFLEQNYNN